MEDRKRQGRGYITYYISVGDVFSSTRGHKYANYQQKYQMSLDTSCGMSQTLTISYKNHLYAVAEI